MARAHERVTEVTIPITSGASPALDLSEATIVAIITPSSWTAADITPECALRSGADAAWGTLYDDLGATIVHSAGASRCIRLDERMYQHVAQVRFKADGQAAARTLLVKVVPIERLIDGAV